MTSMLPAIVFATSGALTSAPINELERHYWDCDYASAQSLLDSSSAANCSLVYERLKTEKFHSDFPRFLRWWKTNKEREHAARVSAQSGTN
jgi:hypothetical protein